MNRQSFKKYVLDAYKSKHRSCGGCQQRWQTMKKTIKPLQQAPQVLQNKAQNDGEINDLLNMLWRKE
tara:strand:- start:304 stop:504 length:201 start_codon:yes stop_codon:yes gene_type:complete